MSAVSRSSLQEEFNSSRDLETRIHYMMAHQEAKDPHKLTQLLQIAHKLGATYDQPAGSGGWSPLDVAVISGYQLGVEHLLGIGVNPSERTFEFATEFHPDYIPLLKRANNREPHTVSKELSQVFEKALSEIFERPFGELSLTPEGTFTYENYDDFGVVIKNLFLSCDQPDMPMKHLIRDMKALGQQLGFEIEFTGSPYNPRDQFFYGVKGVLMGGASGMSDIGPSREQIEKGIERGMSWAVMSGVTAASFTNHFSFRWESGGILSRVSSATQDYTFRLGKRKTEGRLYMEGGNILTVSNTRGKKVVIGGVSLLGINLALAHLSKMLDEYKLIEQKQRGSVQYLNQLPDDAITGMIEEMFALRMVKIEGKSGFLDQKTREKLFQKMDQQDEHIGLKRLALDENVVSPIPEKVKQSPQTYLSAGREFAYLKGFVHKLLEETLGVDRGALHFVPEMASRLDTFMHPGPKGIMFVQSYEMSHQFLVAILKSADQIGLTDVDKKILKRYVQTAAQLQQDLKGLTARVSLNLKKAGITPMPIPAAFYDASLEVSKESTFHVNFISGLSGFSLKTQKYYYITTGAQVGDKLGGVLMDLFTWYFKQFEPNVDIFFIGEDPQNRGDFSEVMRYWNREGSQAAQVGLHNLSLPIQTSVHIEKS